MEEQLEQIQKKEEDLPKSIVVILVVLAVAISILGTFTVLNEISRLNTAPRYEGSPVQSAEIKLTIENPADYIPSVTGKIILNVENKPED